MISTVAQILGWLALGLFALYAAGRMIGLGIGVSLRKIRQQQHID